MTNQTLFGHAADGDIDLESDVLTDVGYPIYRRLFDDDSQFVVDVERRLVEARMPRSVEVYLSRALSIGIASGGILWILGTVLGYTLFATGLVETGPLLGVRLPNEFVLEVLTAARIPFLILTTGLVFGLLGFGVGFGTFVAIPYSRAYTRRREINLLLSDSVSYMYALSVGGLNQLEILEAMARAEDTYGEVAREFQSIVKGTEYFDTDYRSAIRKQAEITPSDELRTFLTDMLSIINSGGDLTSFLDDKKYKQMRTTKQEQEKVLETLELFAEMYLTLSLFPLLLVIIVVVMLMLGNGTEFLLMMTVYALIPILGVLFLVLVATVKQDELGEGVIEPEEESSWLEEETRRGLFDFGMIESFTGTYSVFDLIRKREGTAETIRILTRPHEFFRSNPLYTLAVTVPAALVFVFLSVALGAAPTSWDGVVAQPIWGTFLYLYAPLYIVGIPLAVFREWNVRSRRSVVKTLTDDLRKLASVNDTGATLLESVGVVAETSSGTLAKEFEAMYGKVHYGMSLRESLIEFNNRYRIPRLARTVKLISKAQKASSQIGEVLITAAKASENQDDLERDLRARTRMQIVIIMMTFVTLLGVMAVLKTQFIDTIADLPLSGNTAGFAGTVDTSLLTLLFFHAVTLQAISAGLVSGYVRDTELLAGVKYVVVLATISLVVWAVIV